MSDQHDPDLTADEETLPAVSRPEKQTRSKVPFPTIPGYEFVREIGDGGQGVVFQAIQQSTKRKVAIKILRDGVFSTQRARARFQNEIQLMAQLEHPNIVPVIDSGRSEEGHDYYVMSYISGQRLSEYVQGKRLPVDETLKLVAQVCDAIQYAHERGVIHRDLKPGNVLVDNSGQPRVLDFGLAKNLAGPVDAVMSISRELYGTLPYLSPEQARSTEEIDARSDTYAMGVVVYELLTGSYPYPITENLQDTLRNITDMPPTPATKSWSKDSGITHRSGRSTATRCPVDAPLQAIIFKALEKEPKYRYKHITEFAEDLRRYVAGEPISIPTQSIGYRLKSEWRRHKKRYIVLAVVVGMLPIGAAVFATWAAELEQRRNVESVDEILIDVESLLEQRKELPRVAELLDRALELLPASKRALLNRGRLRMAEALVDAREDRGDHLDAALADFQQAAELGSAAALAARSEALFLAGRMEEGARNFQSLRGQHPDAVEYSPFYQWDLDPLKADATLAENPNQAGLRVNRSATIYRTINTSLNGSLHEMFERGEGRFVAELMHDPLFVLDRSLSVIPNPNVVQLVEDDGLETTVHLRPGLTWHDGQTFNAHDVAATWEYSKLISPDVFLQFESVVADSDTRVRFVHRKKTSVMRWNMRFAILPEGLLKEVAAEAGDAQAFSDAVMARLRETPIGNGPYRCVEVSDDAVLLERWKDYAGEPAKISAVQFQIVPRRELPSLLAAGRIDAAGLTAALFKWDVNGKSYSECRKVRHRDLTYDYIAWNLEHAFLEDSEVRAAVALATPLDELRQRYSGGLYLPCPGIFSGWSWTDGAKPLMPYDPKRASAILESAGWELDPATNMRAKNGIEAAFTLLLPEEAPTTQRIGAAMKVALAEVGVEVTVEVLPNRLAMALFVEKEDETGVPRDDVGGWLSSVVPNLLPQLDGSRWVTDGPKNLNGYTNKEVDRQFEAALAADDGQSRTSHLRVAEERIYQDQPYMFLWLRPSLWAFSDRLRGVEFSARGPLGFYPGPRAWWVPE